MSLLVRLGLASVFLALGAVALLYAAATAPPASRGEAGPIGFRWTAAETACLEAFERCEGDILIARASAAPLSARPFAMQLLREITSGNVSGMEMTATEVLARDPRSRDARHVLSAAALREEELEGFLDLFLPLFDVDGAERAAYADFLAALSHRPALRAAIGARLDPETSWAQAYLRALASRGGVPVSEMIPLYRKVPAAQAALLRRLTQNGDWDLAYVAFADFVSAGPQGPVMALSAPFNPEFIDSRAPPPFNWARVSRGAQILREGGGYAFYEGRRAETLLVQTFPLPSGKWELETVASGAASESGGYFRWQLACSTGGPAVAQFDIRSLAAAPSPVVSAFELAPGACPYLTLSLRGVPGAFPRPARIELASVRLTRQAPVEAGP